MSKVKHKTWTKEECEYLKGNWGMIPTSEIARTLKRTRASVQRKATRMKLKMCDEKYERATGKTRWTDEMKDYLRENYGIIPLEQLMQEMGIDSPHKIKHQARALGLTKEYHKWTDAEEEHLIDKWGEKPVEALAKDIGVSEAAIKTKAHNIGLRNQLHASGNWYSVQTTADILGVADGTVYYWIDKGYIKTRKLKVGKSYRYRVNYTYLIEFLEKHQNRYDTRKCNMGIIKGLLTTHLITKGDRFKISDIPKWLDEKIESDKQRPLLGGPREWTLKEESKLWALSQGGKEVKDISLLLDRTPNSIRSKLRELRERNQKRNRTYLTTYTNY